MSKISRNFFNHVRLEKALDGMVAWLISCATDPDATLCEVGRSFVRFLLRSDLRAADRIIESAVLGADGIPLRFDGPGEVSRILRVQTQHRRIDVYSCAEIDGHIVSFVIEDKTDTTEHSGQLARYRRIVQSDNIREDYIKLIYLKTGMPYDGELESAASAHYCYIGVHDLAGFLGREPAASAPSDLLRQYREYIETAAAWQKQAQRELNMDCGPIQYRFAEKLKARTAAVNSKYGTPDKPVEDVIWKATNLGGSSWTQYRFLGRHLCWRMDSWKHLRLKVSMDIESLLGAKLGIEQYREHFRIACADIGAGTLSFGRRSGNEMTIGVIPYPNHPERAIGKDLDGFLNLVSRVHERFLERITEQAN